VCHCAKAFHKCSQGLSQLVKATVAILPRLARESFVSAQNVSIKHKDRLAREIIREHAENARASLLSSNLPEEIIRMATRLGVVWGFTNWCA
jgi:hypothetical protein